MYIKKMSLGNTNVDKKYSLHCNRPTANYSDVSFSLDCHMSNRSARLSNMLS